MIMVLAKACLLYVALETGFFAKVIHFLFPACHKKEMAKQSTEGRAEYATSDDHEHINYTYIRRRL